MTKTNDDIYEKVVDIHEKVIGLRSDFVDLKRHVNDEHDALIGVLDTKQDQTELLASIGVQLMNHKLFRWGLGAAATFVLGTVLLQHWVGPFGGAVQRLVDTLSG